MKTKREPDAIREERKALPDTLKELSDEELEQVIGGRNWLKFGTYVLSHGGKADPALEKLVLHIVTFSWAAVADDVKTEPISSNPIVLAALANA